MSKRERDEDDVPNQGKAEEVSLSVGDTNKLREKLGLKPLTEGIDDKQAAADAQLDAERNVAAQAKVAARIKKAKEKREYSKTTTVKSLGEDDGEDPEDMANWVKRMRKKQGKTPSAAEKQAKMFDDADEAEQEAAYTENDLKGLQMNAQVDDFNEGKEVIMTLKDTSILDGDGNRGFTLREDGDELENLMLEEKRTAEKNKKLRGYQAGGSAYTGLDDHEWNEDGSINTEGKSVLSKYDAEIGDEKVAPSMVIGVESQATQAARDDAAKLNAIRGKIKENLNTVVKSKIVEQYTQEEFASFAKPKKMKKKEKTGKRKKKKESINWDEEESKAIAEIGADHGSREMRNRAKEQERQTKIKDAESKLNYSKALAKASEATQESAERQFKVVNDYDSEEEDDLGSALAKARQLKMQKISHKTLEEMAGDVTTEANADEEERKKKEEEEDEEDEDDGKITLDATSEFCKMVEVDEAAEDDDDDMPAPRDEEMDVEEEEGGRAMVDSDDSDDEGARGTEFTSENLVSRGMGAALDYIRGRGTLNDTHESTTGRFNDKVMGNEYVDNAEVDKETGKKLNSFTLEYRDKFGRKMSQKEAFRQLSYGFHGKGPGKSKIEARQRKYAEEQRLRKQGQNGAIDQPITLQALKVQQKGTRQAHMVIGGGAGGMRHD